MGRKLSVGGVWLSPTDKQKGVTQRSATRLLSLFKCWFVKLRDTVETPPCLMVVLFPSTNLKLVDGKLSQPYGPKLGPYCPGLRHHNGNVV